MTKGIGSRFTKAIVYWLLPLTASKPVIFELWSGTRKSHTVSEIHSSFFTSCHLLSVI